MFLNHKKTHFPGFVFVSVICIVINCVLLGCVFVHRYLRTVFLKKKPFFC